MNKGSGWKMDWSALSTGALLAAALLSGCGGAEPQARTPALGVDVVGELVAANAAADRALNLVHRERLTTGEVAEFYEPTPGQVIFSMAGQPSGAPALLPRQVVNRTTEEIWSLVAPGRAMPSALAGAALRARQQPAQAADGQGAGKVELPAAAAEGARAEQAALQLEPVSAALTSGYCGTRWLTDFPEASGDNYDWRYLDAHGSGLNAWVKSGVGAYYNVCPEIGSVVLTINGSGGGGAWTVLQDTYRWYSHSAGWFITWQRFDQTATITNNGSSWFNFEGYFDW
jgi:hypothetical protein